MPQIATLLLIASDAGLNEMLATYFRDEGYRIVQTGEGMEGLRHYLTREVEIRTGAEGEEGQIVASVRQIELLESLREDLAAAEAALGDAAPLEAVLVDLNGALGSVGRILGVDISDVVLDRIFSAFCLGK